MPVSADYPSNSLINTNGCKENLRHRHHILDAVSHDCRTLDDIQSLAGLAKLESEQLMPGVQCLSFTEQMDNEAVILMEVDASLLDHLMVGDRLV